MTKNKGSIAIPACLIAMGTGWLLTTHDVLPGVNWVWVLGLGIVGVLILALGGIDRFTLVVGPFLIISSVFSILRQRGRISPDTEIPCLVIAAGILMLVSRFAPVPSPRWLTDDAKVDSRSP
ncbi:MAG: hypothetical protein ACYTFA_07135 [Planctomycetota bacterium]